VGPERLQKFVGRPRVRGAKEGQAGQDAAEPVDGIEFVRLALPVIVKRMAAVRPPRALTEGWSAAAQVPVFATDRAALHRPLGRAGLHVMPIHSPRSDGKQRVCIAGQMQAHV
jgi:hypothetical protein